MDLRESPAHQQAPPRPHHHQHHQRQIVMMAPPPLNSYTTPLPYNNNIDPPPNNNTLNQQQQNQQQQNQQQNQGFPFNSPAQKAMDSVNSQYTDGSSPSSGFRPTGFSTDPANKKKRGRPRKYSPDGDIALGLSPAPTPQPTVTSIAAAPMGPSDSAPAAQAAPGSSSKKGRGRPPGSWKKQLDALGSFGVGFTPHVIPVKAEEWFKLRDEINEKLYGFVPEDLLGSFLMEGSNGNHSRIGGLSVSLAGADGRVLGGGVAGMLVAATPVQVIVGSFIADGKKPKSGLSPAPPPVLSFGASVPGNSEPSDGGSDEGESSDGSGSSPINRGPGAYNNARQPITPMYGNMGWPNSTMNMLPN